MGCSRNKEARLSWVRGNDVLLKVWLFERCLDEHGEEVLQPFVVDSADSLSASLVNVYGRKLDLTPNKGEASNELVLDILGNTPTGCYCLEIKAVCAGRNVRTFESCLLRIVECNREAKTVFTPIESGREASVEITVQMVSSAVARGKNAYELWLDAGNEGTLQDYLDLFTQPASRTRDGLMTKDAYAKLESIVEATAEDVEQAWQRVFGD